MALCLGGIRQTERNTPAGGECPKGTHRWLRKEIARDLEAARSWEVTADPEGKELGRDEPAEGTVCVKIQRL